MAANYADTQGRAQVEQVLRDRYFSMIPERPEIGDLAARDRDRFSRAVAAFAIEKLSGCDPTLAASAIVDCGDDNGIDAIHFEPGDSQLWLIQSKYGNAPSRAESQVFCSGIRDLIDRRFDRFRLSGENPEFDRVQPDIEAALDTAATQVIAAVVYMGNPLGPHAQSDLSQLCDDQNTTKQWFEWKDVGLPVLHSWLSSENALSPIDVQLELVQWSNSERTPRAFYGLVKAADLGSLYAVHGKRLFDKNIRSYMGNQSVNAAITQTILERPAELFFLNNGLTAICSNIAFAGARGGRNRFVLQGFSIVNGAQTIGSIGNANQSGPISQDAYLYITLIETGVGQAAVELGNKITQTRNTQNAVRIEDFAAQDPTQERLRQELAISGVVYHYRSSEEVQANHDTEFTFTEAALARACLVGDTSLIVVAKRNSSQLYDRNRAEYGRLFPTALSGVTLYRHVQVYRYLYGILQNQELTEAGRRRNFFRHGRYFILHIWARRNQPAFQHQAIVLTNDEKLQFSATILQVAESVYDVAEQLFSANTRGYLAIFRNQTDATQLAQAVMSHQ